MIRPKIKRKMRWAKYGKRSYNLADFWQLIIYSNGECLLSRSCQLAMPISREYAALVLRSHFQKVNS